MDQAQFASQRLIVWSVKSFAILLVLKLNVSTLVVLQKTKNNIKNITNEKGYEEYRKMGTKHNDRAHLKER